MRRVTTAFVNAIPLPGLAAQARAGAGAGNGRARTLCSAPTTPLRVLITGSTAGLGLALAEKFVRNGNHVVVNSRRQRSVEAAIAHLQELGPEGVRVTGSAGDVANPADVAQIFRTANSELDGLDAVICNAGSSTNRVPTGDVPPEEIVEAINATFTGAILTVREALAAQVGHIFCMEGAGSDGFATPRMSTYGASKRGLDHFVSSVRREKSDSKVHLLSPGMMPTRLLLKSGSTPRTRLIFNALCEEPDTVAGYLVPKIEDVVRQDSKPTAIRFLTIPGGIQRLAGRALLGWRKDRLFIEATGERVGEGEFDQLGVRKSGVDQADSADVRDTAPITSST